MKLIDKDAVLAEIERYKHKADERLKIKNRTLAEDLKDSALQNLCGNLMHFLDTLEVKEVDLGKEVESYWWQLDLTWCRDAYSMTHIRSTISDIAKHFFELGLKAQKDNIRYSMNETPKYPCDILLVTDVDNMFLFRYMENGRPVDRETPYFHNIQNGKCWYYCNDIMNIH